MLDHCFRNMQDIQLVVSDYKSFKQQPFVIASKRLLELSPGATIVLARFHIEDYSRIIGSEWVEGYERPTDVTP